MGQTCISDKTVSREHEQELSQNPAIQNADVCKAKLKHARDRINQFISKKQSDCAQIDRKIAEKLPHYQKTRNKKQMVPLLQAKKDINDFIQKAQVRLRLVNEKIHEVEMQQVNADTIRVLGDANLYIKQIENQLENRDWRGVLEEAQHKYQLDWDFSRGENLEQDPAFKAMWKELGGNKLDSQRNVHVQIPQNHNNRTQVHKTSPYQQRRVVQNY